MPRHFNCWNRRHGGAQGNVGRSLPDETHSTRHRIRRLWATLTFAVGRRATVSCWASLIRRIRMTRHKLLVAAILGLLCQSAWPDQPVQKPTPRPARKVNPAFAEVRDDAALPRVLLIGDSISIGYTVAVRELL